MRVAPLTIAQLNSLVSELHRHHKPITGHRFSLGLFDGDKLIGACSVGRPVARKTNQYEVAEVTRLVTDGTKNACSMLYAAATRACRAMGFKRIQTFILASEPGTSLKASGWKLDGESKGKNGWHSREARRNGPTEIKLRWVKDLYT